MKKILLVFVLVFSVFWVFADEKSDNKSAEAESEIAKSENPTQDGVFASAGFSF